MRATADEVGRRRRHEAAVQTIRVEPAEADAARDYADRDQLEGAFQRLSIDHRAVVVLYHFVGLSATRGRDRARDPAWHREVPPPPRDVGAAGGPRGLMPGLSIGRRHSHERAARSRQARHRLAAWGGPAPGATPAVGDGTRAGRRRRAGAPIGLDLGGWSFGSARARWAIIGVVLAVLALGAMVGAGAALFRGTTTSLPGAVNGWVAFTAEGRTRQSESDIWLVRDGVEEFCITGSDSDVSARGMSSVLTRRHQARVRGRPGRKPRPRRWSRRGDRDLGPSGRPADPEVRIPLESWHQICPKWSPDGQTVAFVDSDTTLWTARVDGTLTRVGGLGPATNGMSQIAFSPDGTAVAATDEQGSGLWIRPLDGSEPRIFQRAEPGVDFTPGPTLEGPRYSADGTRIAVAAHGAAGSSLLVYRLGGEQLPVELEGGDVFAWSPTGHELRLRPRCRAYFV